MLDVDAALLARAAFAYCFAGLDNLDSAAFGATSELDQFATHCTTATFTFSPISTSRRMDRHDWVVTLLSRPGVYAGMSSSDIRNARTGSFPVAGRPRFFDCFP